MLHVPAERSGKAYKFARPFRGPYRVVKVWPNGVELVLISKPKAQSIRVSLDRVQRCPREMTELDDFNEVPIADLFDNPDAMEETETCGGIIEAPADGQRDQEPLPARRSQRLRLQVGITRM